MQLRSDRAKELRARRWIDAEAVADAKTLLMDLDPQRRILNVDPAVVLNRICGRILISGATGISRLVPECGGWRPDGRLSAEDVKQRR